MNYQFKTWDDLTINDCLEIIKIDVPDQLKDLYMSKDQDEYMDKYIKITDQQRIDLSGYYGQIIKLMTNIPEAVADTLSWWQRIDIYETHLQQMIIDLYSDIPSYKPRGIEKFEFKDEVYYFPASIRIFDDLVPMAGETALTFTESSEIWRRIIDMKERGLESLPLLIAVLCRKKDEPYDEKTSLERSGIFVELPMAIAWEVFFYIIRQLSLLMKNIQTFTETASMDPRSAMKLLNYPVLKVSDQDSGFMRLVRVDYLED